MTQKLFYDIRADSAEEAFGIAAANSKLPAMKKLIADGVDINTRTVVGQTPLIEAAYLGLTRVVRLLVDAGADLNLRDEDELTALMHASGSGGKKGSAVAQILIDAGADVTCVREGDTMTALKFAAESCTPEVIQSLIDHGADVDGPPETEQTALMQAARYGHVEGLKVLIANGADPEKKCGISWAKGWTALQLAELEKRKKAVAYLRGLAKE